MLDATILLGTAGFVAGLVYRYDRYDREPLLAILFAIALGAAACWPATYVEVGLLGLLPLATDHALPLAAGVVEEALKLLGVAILLVALRKRVNDPMDGVTYGAFIGLGFGVGEAFLVGEGGVRDVVRVFFHAALGGVDGFALGMAAVRMAGWGRRLAAWTAAAILLHVAWDFVAFAIGSASRVGPVLRLAPLALMLALFGLYGFSVAQATRWSKRVFAPAERTRVWGWPFERPTTVAR